MSYWYIAALIGLAAGFAIAALGLNSASHDGSPDAWGSQIIGVAVGIVLAGVAAVLALIGWLVG